MDDGTDNILLRMLGVLIAILPVIGLPFLFKAAGGIVGRVYNGINGSRVGKAMGGLDSAGSDFARRRLRNAEANMAQNPNQTSRGRAARFFGGYRARRNFKNSTQDANQQRMQQDALAALASERDASDNPTRRAQRFAEAASGAGGATGATRVQARARDAVEKLKNEDIDLEVKSLKFRGVDFAGLESVINNRASSDTQIAAASEVLMTAGAVGVDRFRAALNRTIDSGNVRGNSQNSQAIVDAMRRNLDTLDRSSPDLADFSRSGAAANTIATSATRTDLARTGGIGEHYNFSGKSAEQIITYTPATSDRALNAARPISQASAELAVQSRNISGAKPATREIIEYRAGRLAGGRTGAPTTPTAYVEPTATS